MSHTSVPFYVCLVSWVHSALLALELGYVELSHRKEVLNVVLAMK